MTRREFVASATLLAASAALGAAEADPKMRNAALSRKLPTEVAPNATWPVLTRYDEDHLARIAMPLGGIGTGSISLGGRGDLRDWELVNCPAKGYAPINSFFAIHTRDAKGTTVTRALEGPIDPSLYEGASGASVRNHNLPRFRHCNFACAYPLGQVLLSDPDVPLDVRIDGFNPLIPCDADASGVPVAVLRFVLTNRTGAPVSASICGTIENFISWNGREGKCEGNTNTFRENDGIGGLFMQAPKLDPKHASWGTLALATTAKETTHRTTWAELSWGDTLLDFWDDFSADGKLDPRESKRDAPFGSLSASVDIAAGASETITFLIAWHFPNRLSWSEPHDRIGNHYCTKYADAWDVIEKAAPKLPDLEAKTVEFVRAFCESDLPAVVKEAALYNVSTLRTQTTFRAENGTMHGWEGCGDHGGCCHGSCTHVWNYEQATAFLFGDLARSMRQVEFGNATDDRGLMSFRVNLPIANAQQFHRAAADGQMGTIMKLHRDWKLSGDDAMLKRLYPGAKRALEFCWIKGGWDADRDGVMEGAQHNTMDVEYFGPNAQMGAWYLGALRASEEMARQLKDDEFAKQCRELFGRGSKWIDANLFNGEFYEHRIVPPKDAKDIAEGLVVGMGGDDLKDPALQLGAACLVDQLVGQYMAHVCGLGYLLDHDKVKKTLASVLKYNWRDDFYGHFNHFRSFVLGDEQALLMATYPKGRRPKRPFPYCNEVMTGFEYTAAAGMMFEGMIDEGVRVVAAIRDRYDGRKRSPFDEAECGHHYARAMASWACVLALTGFHYDGTSATMKFAASNHPTKWFWSSGNAWGVVTQFPSGDSVAIRLDVRGGKIAIGSFSLRDFGKTEIARSELTGGDVLDVVIRRS